MDEIKAALETILTNQRKAGEEVDALTRAVTRLTRAIEQDDTDRFEIEQRDQRRHRTSIDAIDELRDAFRELVGEFDKPRPLLSREEVVAMARMLVDELRQGLALRAIGASPWPTSVPPSDGVPSRTIEEEKSEKKQTVIRIGRFSATIPALTWGGAFLLLKWAFAMAALSGGGWALVRAVLKASAGQVE